MNRLGQEFRRELPVDLSDDDREFWVRKATDADSAVIELEAEKKESNSDYAERIKRREAERTDALNILRAGHVVKMVPCSEIYHWRENTIDVVRLDTGEVVETRTMRSEERQAALDFPRVPTLAERNQAAIDALDWDGSQPAEADPADYWGSYWDSIHGQKEAA